MSCRPSLVWGGILGAGVAAEVHALHSRHHDCTLSAQVRRACHTSHPAGRSAFAVGGALVAAWFLHHIVTWKPPE